LFGLFLVAIDSGDRMKAERASGQCGRLWR